MSNECKLEFYFKAADLHRLLSAHPNAKGVIFSQEIVREKPKGADHYVNVVHYRARVDHGDEMLMGTAPGSGAEGCPYPPGCTD